MNALLPTLRKQYCSLKEAGLSNAAFESDFKEIEHLVERKKVVVWADQTTESDKQSVLPGVSMFMTFPQLAPVQTTTCCTSSSESNLLNSPSQKRTRRKLMSSPLKTEPTQKSALSESIQLNDSFSQELQPIVYTPEGCRKPLQNPSTVTLLKPSSCTTSFQDIGSNIYSENSLKISCEVDLPVSRRKECKQEDLDSMFTICEDTRRLNSKLPEQQSVSNNNIVQRLAPASFSAKHPLPVQSIVPSYMAMTAAAKRKRKLTSSAANTLTAEENSGFAKRVRQDNSSDKHLQENGLAVEYKRNIHKAKANMVRKFGRSISKGNLR